MSFSEREVWIRQNINGIGRQAYPDDADLEWTLHSMAHNGWYSFVEAEPTSADSIGWPRLKFVLRCEAGTQPILVGGYGLVADPEIRAALREVLRAKLAGE